MSSANGSECGERWDAHPASLHDSVAKLEARVVDSHRLFMLVVEELGKLKDENTHLAAQLLKQDTATKHSLGLDQD
ncbi:hypothetical protein FOA52_006267 [Chlamydomonas sp. UWO 241]|nr:hypothetical protein FOA52_006267 [Chlamydomonas sp. UWO 241]